MATWGDITAEARKRLTPVDTALLRQFAARERQPYDQVLLPLLLEAAADEIDQLREHVAQETEFLATVTAAKHEAECEVKRLRDEIAAREAAERELIQHKLQRAAEMREGKW